MANRVIYLCGFFWAVSQKSPHAVLESLHVHFLCRLSVVYLNLVDLQEQVMEEQVCKTARQKYFNSNRSNSQ